MKPEQAEAIGIIATGIMQADLEELDALITRHKQLKIELWSLNRADDNLGHMRELQAAIARLEGIFQAILTPLQQVRDGVLGKLRKQLKRREEEIKTFMEANREAITQPDEAGNETRKSVVLDNGEIGWAFNPESVGVAEGVKEEDVVTVLRKKFDKRDKEGKPTNPFVTFGKDKLNKGAIKKHPVRNDFVEVDGLTFKREERVFVSPKSIDPQE
jgi:DNA polymerase IIIc chi subunit